MSRAPPRSPQSSVADARHLENNQVISIDYRNYPICWGYRWARARQEKGFSILLERSLQGPHSCFHPPPSQLQKMTSAIIRVVPTIPSQSAKHPTANAPLHPSAAGFPNSPRHRHTVSTGKSNKKPRGSELSRLYDIILVFS